MSIKFPTIHHHDQMLYNHDDGQTLRHMLAVFMNDYCHRIGYTANCTFKNGFAHCDLVSHELVFDLNVDARDLASRLSREIPVSGGGGPAVPMAYHDALFDNRPVQQRLLCAWRIFLSVLEARGYLILADNENFKAGTFMPMAMTVQFISKTDGLSFKGLRQKAPRGFYLHWDKGDKE